MINQNGATKIEAGLLDSHRKRQQEQHPGLTLTGNLHRVRKDPQRRAAYRSSAELAERQGKAHP